MKLSGKIDLLAHAAGVGVEVGLGVEIAGFEGFEAVAQPHLRVEIYGSLHRERSFVHLRHTPDPEFCWENDRGRRRDRFLRKMFNRG